MTYAAKVFIVYADYGTEGCLKPQAAFPRKADATLWLHETKPYWWMNAKIEELDILAYPEDFQDRSRDVPWRDDFEEVES